MDNIPQLDGCDTSILSESDNNDYVKSNIFQVDGNISDVSSILSSNDTQYDTDDEAFAEPIAANLSPVPGQTLSHGQPIILDINSQQDSSPHLPLCLEAVITREII